GLDQHAWLQLPAPLAAPQPAALVPARAPARQGAKDVFQVLPAGADYDEIPRGAQSGVDPFARRAGPEDDRPGRRPPTGPHGGGGQQDAGVGTVFGQDAFETAERR